MTGIGAALLYFSNFALSAIAVILSVRLFRHSRQIGWLVLAAAFLSPFVFLLLRLAHGKPLLTYRSGMTYRLDIPGFYMLVVAALLLFMRDARRGK